MRPGQSLKENSSRLPCDPSADGYTRNLVSKYAGLVVWRPEGSGPVVAAQVPTEQEKLALMGRLEKLKDTLLPASISQPEVARVAAAVAGMLGGGYTSLQNVDRKATIAGYTEALQDLPAWAVENGCGNVRHGKVDGLDPDWPPTHARMHLIAEKELAPVKLEQAQIMGVITLQLPPQKDEAEAERMTAKAKAWLDRSDPVAAHLMEGLGIAKPASEEANKQLAEFTKNDIRREWEAAGLEPRPYSMSLAKNLGAISENRKSEGEAA
jgi:hypothetical protein